jgi:two-component system LytT family response regulator
MPELQCLFTSADPAAFQLLPTYAARLPWLKIIGKTINTREARHYLQEFDVDILFCDAATVTEPEMENFFINKAGKILVIVLASPDELTTCNFKCDIFSFLEKPVSFEKFFNAVSRAKLYLRSFENSSVSQAVDYVFIKSEYKFYRVKFNEIIFCESMKDYTQVYVTNKIKPITTLQNLKTFANKLPNDDFIRVHRSYLVSLEKIDVVTKSEITIGQKLIPIGESYRSSLFKLIQQSS